VLLGLHAARDGLQLLAELLGLLIKLLDFGDLSLQLVALLRKVIVGDDELRQHQDVADIHHATAQILAELKNFFDHQRRTGERLADGPLAPFIALGQLDLALAGKQRNGAHLAQIHAHGVVRFFGDILG